VHYTNLLRTITVTLCTAALFGCSSHSSDAGKKGPVLAEVNGTKITAGEFSREVENLPPQLQPLTQTDDGKKKLLDNMVLRELIMQQAKKDSIDKSKEVTEELEKLTRQVEDLKKQLIFTVYLRKKYESQSKFNDADLKKFLDDAMASGEIRASHILLPTEKEAQDLLAQLKAGGNFEALAKKNSKDSSAQAGGDVGWFSKLGAMVPAFETAAFSLKPGEVSGVVKTDFGYHIIKVTGKRPLAKPQGDIKEIFQKKMQQEFMEKLKADLKKNAKITLHEDALKGLEAGNAKPMAMPMQHP
jgi:peptidyl-prolyl cis-trans isomerase C